MDEDELRAVIMNAVLVEAYGPSKMGDCSGYVVRLGKAAADAAVDYLDQEG